MINTKLGMALYQLAREWYISVPVHSLYRQSWL
jgi:hypothetical protein